MVGQKCSTGGALKGAGGGILPLLYKLIMPCVIEELVSS